MQLSKDHIKSINKALHFIDVNLESDLSLDQISKIAHYSPYHFHRLFKAFTNETLNNYIARKRVEKASAILLRKKHITISDLSIQYGFSSNSSFTRAFKTFYGVSPSHFRRQGKGAYSKIRQVKSKNGQAITTFEDYVCETNHKNKAPMESHIEVKTIKTLNVVGMTCIGSHELTSTFNRLLEWAGPQGLLRTPDFKMATIYYDSFKITAPDKVRLSACLLVDEPIKTEGEVTAITINKGLYIVAHHEIGIHEFERVWTSLFMWMNNNGYKMRNEPPFEIYHNNFNEHPEKLCILDLYIPVE